MSVAPFYFVLIKYHIHWCGVYLLPFSFVSIILEVHNTMPVTKTARRALRGSKEKESFNKITMGKLEGAIRLAKKSKSEAKIITAISLTDRAAKKKVIFIFPTNNTIEQQII